MPTTEFQPSVTEVEWITACQFSYVCLIARHDLCFVLPPKVKLSDQQKSESSHYEALGNLQVRIHRDISGKPKVINMEKDAEQRCSKSYK